MSDRHLDDEQLSTLLDDESGDRAHVESCASCSARFAALRGARDAIATATVAPLSADVLDRLVGQALDAGPVADPAIVPLTRGRRRLPPPAWLAGVAAALLLLVGVVGAVRSLTGRSYDDSASMALRTSADNDAGGRQSNGKADQSASADGGAGGSVAADAAESAARAPALYAADPEAVAFDLADQQDPSELAVLLRDRVPVAEGTAASGASTAATVTTVPPAPQSPAADRARCRSQAEAAGADAIGPLLTTGTVRWKGRTAEVLVFQLRTPADGVTRQAMVLERPGCSLLAEQRF